MGECGCCVQHQSMEAARAGCGMPHKAVSPGFIHILRGHGYVGMGEAACGYYAKHYAKRKVTMASCLKIGFGMQTTSVRNNYTGTRKIPAWLKTVKVGCGSFADRHR